MGSIVLTTLSLFLGLLFILMGSFKVTQLVNRDIHREVRRNFVQFAKVLPLVAMLGLKVSAKHYRLTVGYLEIVCGFILVFVPGRIKVVANSVLIFLSLGTIYTHYMVKDRFDRIAPSIVFTLMLCCRLVVHYQVQRRDARKLAAALERTKQQSPTPVQTEYREEHPQETDKDK